MKKLYLYNICFIMAACINKATNPLMFRLLALFLLTFFPINAFANTENAADKCDSQHIKCLTNHLANLALKIEKDSWRDQTYRELSKSLAAAGYALDAIPYIGKIKSPDTKALTIRGIGMEAAMAEKVPEGLFIALRAEAEKITDPPSYGIALTYIAMAQAFADQDTNALKTASEMENEALRNKAYGETAEIQAEKGKFELALNSISFIESVSFKNKAYKSVSRIFAEDKQYQQAYDTALFISNPVMEAQAIQFILDAQRKDKEQKEND